MKITTFTFLALLIATPAYPLDWEVPEGSSGKCVPARPTNLDSPTGSKIYVVPRYIYPAPPPINIEDIPKYPSIPSINPSVPSISPYYGGGNNDDHE